VLFPSTDQQ
jgi:hypothetical protein